MRASDYLAIFNGAGFDVCRCETEEDDEARESMRDGFPVDEKFSGYSVYDLCATQLKVALLSKKF